MKIQLKLILLLFGVSFISFLGCKKDNDGVATTITGTNLNSPKPGTLTGTFTVTGAFKTSGTHVMVVQPVGKDSIHCTWTMTAKEGTFIMIQNCSLTDMTGSWYILSGTGRYEDMRGKGTLIMMFPPNVPPGVLSTETNTGTVWLH